MPIARLMTTMNKDTLLTPGTRRLALGTLVIRALTGFQAPPATAQAVTAGASLAVSAMPVAQDLGAIEAAAKDEIRRQAPESIAETAPLDARLRIAACDRPLRASLPPSVTIGPRANVRVACTGGLVNWSVTVPVAISTETAVIVANRLILMGSPIGAEDISLEVRRFPGTVRCCATNPDEVVGLLARRTIPVAGVIPLDAIAQAPAIKRGELVTVVASLPGMEIRSTGVALGDARPGEAVRIRHSASSKVIQARADTPGVVRVDR